MLRSTALPLCLAPARCCAFCGAVEVSAGPQRRTVMRWAMHGRAESCLSDKRCSSEITYVDLVTGEHVPKRAVKKSGSVRVRLLPDALQLLLDPAASGVRRPSSLPLPPSLLQPLQHPGLLYCLVDMRYTAQLQPAILRRMALLGCPATSRSSAVRAVLRAATAAVHPAPAVPLHLGRARTPSSFDGNDDGTGRARAAGYGCTLGGAPG